MVVPPWKWYCHRCGIAQVIHHGMNCKLCIDDATSAMFLLLIGSRNGVVVDIYWNIWSLLVLIMMRGSVVCQLLLYQRKIV